MVSLKNIYLLNRQISSIFDRSCDYETGTWTPFADVYESNEKYHIVVELPGMSEDQITAEAEGRVLKIKGNRRTKHEGCSYHQIERGCGGFLRVFELPEMVDLNSIEALLKDGILMIEIDKKL